MLVRGRTNGGGGGLGREIPAFAGMTGWGQGTLSSYAGEALLLDLTKPHRADSLDANQVVHRGEWAVCDDRLRPRRTHVLNPV